MLVYRGYKMNNTEKIDQIRIYYMNPDLYSKKNKEEIENAIKTLDNYLLCDDDTAEGKELFEALSERYSTADPNSPINTLMLQTRIDDEGISATKGYAQIYFNEIVQNANDNTTGTDLWVIVDKNSEDYIVDFYYDDKGFSVQNIIGLFNVEFHIKKNDMSTTGKHGVGIKSLFYFVDELSIASNIEANFKIAKLEEEDMEIAESELKINDKWDQKTTHLRICYKQKENYKGFNVKKLNRLIELIIAKANSEEVKTYFEDEDQEKLVFDYRSLLFMDKNKGKTVGIKNIYFGYKNKENISFSISSETEEEKIKIGEKNIEKNCLKFNENVRQIYYVVTIEKNNEQNFSVAFPQFNQIKKTKKRFYETFYIPNAPDTDDLNLLVNSKYSSVDRRKLTDKDEEEKIILDCIDNDIMQVFKFITSEECQKGISSEWRKEISQIFHVCLETSDEFIKLCYENKIHNRYLMKYEEKGENGLNNRYIAYRKEPKEAYEKKLLGQTWSKDDVIAIVEKYILKEDAIVFDENKYIKELLNVYRRAFETDEKELCYVLWVYGSIKELIKFRIKGNRFCESLVLSDIDNWIIKENIERKDEKIVCSLIGRYNLYPYINAIGDMTGASFYEYLFQEGEETSIVQRQKSFFNEKYEELKKKLHLVFVNAKRGGTVSFKGIEGPQEYNKKQIVFCTSYHVNASYDTYYDKGNCTIYGYHNTDALGVELYELFLRLWKEDKNFERHTRNFVTYMMLTDSAYPEWGNLKEETDHPRGRKTEQVFWSGFINLSFMQDVKIHSLEQYEKYISYFTIEHAFWEKWIKSIDAEFEYSEDCLQKLFALYYKTGIWKKYKIHLKIKMNNVVEYKNCCPQEFCMFIEKLTGLKISLMQIAQVKGKKELIYLYNNKLKMWLNNSWEEIAEVVQESENKNIFILCNQPMDMKNAVCKVLSDPDISNITTDTVEKCSAYIFNDQLYAASGDDYVKFIDKEMEENRRTRKKFGEYSANGLSADQLKYIISARGNNDGTCCCCGRKMEKKELIIVDNSSEQTKEKYAKIINVVCKECCNILKISHKKSEVINEDGKWKVEHTCVVQNSHQSKTVKFSYCVSDGVRQLWK